MARMRGVDRREEVDVSQILRDSRPLSIIWMEALGDPKRFGITLAVIAVIGLAARWLVPFLILVTIFLWVLFRARRPALPLRVPANIKAPDISDLDSKGKPKIGDGILYLGNDRGAYAENEECWITNSDARTHAMVLGTTGSGKSEFLMSLAFNAIAWGSGFIFVDGKADNSLPFKIYSMCKRAGREDDFFVVNFITGDVDAFTRSRDDVRSSNTINVFSDGSSNSWTQMVSSLMAEAGGDNALWKGLAVGMINAVLTGLAYKKWRYGEPVDAGVIRDHIELGKLIELTREFASDPDVPRDLVFKPLEAYLLNLPGFDWAKNLEQGNQVSEDTKKQHDFRSMQFLRQLTMLADTYGNIFKHRLPEVDLLDVVLNRRILVVMIPSLEKSEEESEGLGKLLISALKLMMSMTLGNHIEGMYADTVDSKVTNSPAPYICILDELGYYFTKGLAVMYAQARSLGFMMVGAGQDLPAMMKGKNREEAESVIANSKYKISLAMEDPQSTADLILKTAGEGMVSETSGYTGHVGLATSYRDMLNVSIQRRQRVTLQELRDLDSGQGILLWRDRVVRFTAFYLFGSARLTKDIPVKINRLIKLYAPSASEIEQFSEAFSQEESIRSAKMQSIFMGEVRPNYIVEPDLFAKAFRQACVDLPKNTPPRDALACIFSRTGTIWELLKSESVLAAQEAAKASDGAEDSGSAGASGGGAVKPAAEPMDDVLDVTEMLDQAAPFVVSAKSVVEEEKAVNAFDQLLGIDLGVASASASVQEAEAKQTDWVETALADESGETVVMESSAADMLALMDSSLLEGGAEVNRVDAATRASEQLLEALDYQPVESGTATPENVDETIDELRAMFDGL